MKRQINEKPADRSAAESLGPAGASKRFALSKRSVRLAAICLVICTAAVYANSLSADFIFDDYHDVVENSDIRQPSAIWRAVVTSAGGKMSIHSRPVVALSFALNYALGGMQAWQFHATNVAIHILAGLTLFGIVRRTLLLPRGGDYAEVATPLALVVALLWTLHPLQTQAVTYIVQRYESLMGMFYLMTLYAAIRAMGSPHALRWSILCVTACLLAMGCKEVAVSAPILVLLYDRSFVTGSFREALRLRWRLYGALAACWLAALPLYARSSGGGGLFSSQGPGFAGFGNRTPWYEYALSQPGVILHYLRLCFWPRGQCFDYGWPIAHTASEILPPLALVALLLAATVWCVVHRPAWGFWGAWFFLILAPTSSVMPIADLAFEHRMYLSSAAVVVVAVVGGYEIWRRWAARQPAESRRLYWAPAALAGIAVVALGAQTALRNEIYRSPIAVYQDAVENYPHSARAHLGLAVAYNLAGRPSEGLEQVEQAFAIDPALPGAHGIRAILLAHVGRIDEALAEFAKEETNDPGNAETFSSRGKLYFRQKRFAEAAADYARQLELEPNNGSAFSNRALCYQELGQHVLAIADCEHAIALDPWLATAYWYRGGSYAALQQYDRAVADFAEALRLDSRLTGVYRERAAAYISLGKLDQARGDLASFAAAGGTQDAEFERLSRLAKTTGAATGR
jgi:tetratricopeptide (TPR) repeat protein